MMKNIYYFGGYHVQAKDFRMQVFYEDKDKTLTNFLPVPSEKNDQGEGSDDFYPPIGHTN